MKHSLLAAGLSLMAVPAVWAAAGPATLTNTDIVQMVRSGVPTADIQAQICKSNPSFVLQNQNLLYTMGVSDEVFATMELRQQTGSCAPRPVASYTPPATEVKKEKAQHAEKLQPPTSKKKRILAPWAWRK